jgi:hypothetical protein
MSYVSEIITSYLPPKRKQTPSGWISFNAPCCQDDRQRGGIIMENEVVSYHCFNCGFKASWQPGRTISSKLRKLMQQLHVPDEVISKCFIEALREQDSDTYIPKQLTPTFLTKSLPEGAEPIENYINDPPENLIVILEYLLSRKLYLEDYTFYWSPNPAFSNRLIIPFYYQNRIVGYTARRIGTGSPKYLSEQQPGYVFNLDQQYDRNFIVVCEGPLDAISIDAVSIMGSEINSQQRYMIERLNKRIILIPDRDSAGKKLVEEAVKYNWSVSMPEWQEGIKDVNDAVRIYGKLTTLLMIKNATMTNDVKIKLTAKQWFNT